MAEITTFSTTIGGPHTLKTFSYRLRNPTADTLILEGVRPGTELGIYSILQGIPLWLYFQYNVYIRHLRPSIRRLRSSSIFHHRHITSRPRLSVKVRTLTAYLM
jgi:hypothetical protein